MFPISMALFLRASKSFPVAPATAETLDMLLSNCAVVCTDTAPTPATAADTGAIFRPAAVIFSPAWLNFCPICSSFGDFSALSSFWNCCTSCFACSIFRETSRYSFDVLSTPFASSWFWTSFSCSNFCFAPSTLCLNSVCFWVIRLILVGSSFSALLTSLSEDCVPLVALLICPRALFRPVVSPSNLIVIPFTVPAILFAPLSRSNFQRYKCSKALFRAPYRAFKRLVFFGLSAKKCIPISLRGFSCFWLRFFRFGAFALFVVVYAEIHHLPQCHFFHRFQG